MKKRKLKTFVLPTLYVMVISVLFVTISFLGKTLQEQLDNGDVIVNAGVDDNILPVIKEEYEPIMEGTDAIPMKPYLSNKVTVKKTYYDMNASVEEQQNSLIYYEKTYLQNSGILYTCDEEFDVISVYDGTVTNVAKDDILGNYVEITHASNLKTIYYSLDNVVVKKDDVVNMGTIIATSGTNMLDDAAENSLLFEVHYNGMTINPETFYEQDVTQLD